MQYCVFVAPPTVCKAVLGAFSSVARCFDLAIGGPIFALLSRGSEASGLHVSQVGFLAAVLANCPIAAATRWLPKGNARHIYGTVTTLSLLALAYGRDVQQFVYAGALVYFFMRVFPGDCGYLTWATIFTYQVYLHYERASEESWNAGAIDFTGSFMMFTLKLISVAMDYQDGVKHTYFAAKKTEHCVTRAPTPLEYCGYLFGLGGIIVGPHSYFDEYMRYANNKGEYAALNDSKGKFPAVAGPAIKALMSSCFAAALYFKFGEVITDRAAILTMNHPSIGMWGKLLMGFCANLEYRLKLYFAWHLEETALILSGFGFSGYSTRDGKTPVWTKAVSAAMIECEAAPSVALAVVKWNRHTGFWLRNYVYTRIPMGGLTALLVTQTICGLWHGLSPSFLLFFSHSALLIFCSRILYRVQMKHLPRWTLPYTNLAHSLFTLFMLSYLAGGYNVVSLASCIEWWRSVNYCGHYLMGAIFLLGLAFPKPKKKKA